MRCSGVKRTPSPTALSHHIGRSHETVRRREELRETFKRWHPLIAGIER
jgi:hypothetical protein